MRFDITGSIKEIFEVKTFANDFKKQEFLLTTLSEKYPQNIIFGCLKDKIEILESFKVGDIVKVYFDISGREWNDKYFVNLNAWKIEESENSNKESSISDNEISDSELEDDLPF